MLTKLNQQICKHCFNRYMDFGADKWFWGLELFCHCRVCDIPVIKYGNQFGYWYSIIHYRTILLTVELKQSLQWRHNERDGVSNHQPHDWLLNLYSGADQRKPQSSASLSFVQRPVTRSFHFSFDLRLSRQLSKQSIRRWFETPSRSLWRHCNESSPFNHLHFMDLTQYQSPTDCNSEHSADVDLTTHTPYLPSWASYGVSSRVWKINPGYGGTAKYLIQTSCMMTSSNGNIFRVTGHLCGEFTGPGEFPAQRPVTRSFDAFFDLRLNKRLSKQPRGWWFQTPSW